MNKSKFSLLIGGSVILAIILGFAILPNVMIGASPLLLLFILCPLMMMLMMGGMHRGMGNNQQQSHSGHNPYGILPANTKLTTDEHLARLKSQSSELQKQQEVLTRQINQLEVSPAPPEAEVVARASDSHFKS